MKILSVALLALTLGAPAAQALVLGKVDIQKVLLTINEGKGVREKLKKSFDKKQEILKKDEDKVRKMQESFKKQSLVMSDTAKRTKQESIQKAIMQLQQKSQGFQKEIQDMEQKFKRPILEKVRVIIETVSEKANVDITFEASTAPVVYAKSEKDLTDSVIKAYDSKHK